MIELTKMNHEKFYVNPNLLEVVEVTPDRLITMMSDKKYYVLESVEEIVTKVEEFYQKVYSSKGKVRVKRPE